MKPTLTIVHHGATYAVIASYPVPQNDPTNRPVQATDGIVHFALTLQSALDYAHTYLYDTQSDPPVHTYTNPHFITALTPPPPSNQYLKQVKIRLSDKAWNNLQDATRAHKYHGKALHLGMLNYMRALLKANPTPTHWTDTRPLELTSFDLERANAKKFPYWSQGDYSGDVRKQRWVNPYHLAQITPTLYALAEHFKITPARRDQLDPYLRAHAALEAIGLGYLTPRNPPMPNPRPPKRPPRKKHWEIVW